MALQVLNHGRKQKVSSLLGVVQKEDVAAIKAVVTRLKAEGRWDPRHWSVTMALMLAPSPEIKLYLKDQGATVSSKCLPSAALKGNVELLNVLIGHLKQASVWDPDDWYVVWALVEACAAQNKVIYGELENHGAHLTTKCLPLVVTNMDLARLRLIVTEIKSSSRWDPVDRYVSLALVETQRLNKRTMYEYLVIQGAKPTTQCLVIAVRTANVELLRDIVYYTKIYNSWSETDPHVKWALEETCLIPSKPMYEILVDEGAVPNFQCLLSTVKINDLDLGARVAKDLQDKGVWSKQDCILSSALDRAKQLPNAALWKQILQPETKQKSPTGSPTVSALVSDTKAQTKCVAEAPAESHVVKQIGAKVNSNNHLMGISLAELRAMYKIPNGKGQEVHDGKNGKVKRGNSRIPVATKKPVENKNGSKPLEKPSTANGVTAKRSVTEEKQTGQPNGVTSLRLDPKRDVILRNNQTFSTATNVHVKTVGATTTEKEFVKKESRHLEPVAQNTKTRSGTDTDKMNKAVTSGTSPPTLTGPGRQGLMNVGQRSPALSTTRTKLSAAPSTNSPSTDSKKNKFVCPAKIDTKPNSLSAKATLTKVSASKKEPGRVPVTMQQRQDDEKHEKPAPGNSKKPVIPKRTHGLTVCLAATPIIKPDASKSSALYGAPNTIPGDSASISTSPVDGKSRRFTADDGPSVLPTDDDAMTTSFGSNVASGTLTTAADSLQKLDDVLTEVRRDDVNLQDDLEQSTPVASPTECRTALQDIFNRAIADKQTSDMARSLHDAELAITHVRTTPVAMEQGLPGEEERAGNHGDDDEEEIDKLKAEMRRIFDAALQAKAQDSTVRAEADEIPTADKVVGYQHHSSTVSKPTAVTEPAGMFGGRYKPSSSSTRKARSIPPELSQPIPSRDVTLPSIKSSSLHSKKRPDVVDRATGDVDVNKGTTFSRYQSRNTDGPHFDHTPSAPKVSPTVKPGVQGAGRNYYTQRRDLTRTRLHGINNVLLARQALQKPVLPRWNKLGLGY